jgi:hypothetical protein
MHARLLPGAAATSVVDADAQGCFETNFTDASQTLLLFHPTPGCGGGQPVSMVYRGRRCTSNGGGTTNSSQPGVAGVMWDAAEPAPGSGLSAAQCSLQRRTEASADDAIFNVDWFGSCGVPPARVQYARRSECPAPPPAPPPSPSPRPENEKGLDRGVCMACVLLCQRRVCSRVCSDVACGWAQARCLPARL